MILESIEMTHVGPFLKTVRVGPLARGLNVLAAYNEEGKTMIVRATVRALFDRHTGKSEEIKQLQPVGTSLSPVIAVVLHCAGAKFRAHKIFLSSPRSELSQWRDGRWEPMAEGDAADNRLRELLRSEEPGRGATKPEHWGLFQYLWARQGEPALWPSWDGEAGKLVRSRLARIELDPLIERLKSVFAAEYEEIFTSQGKAKAHGPLEAAKAELARLEAELQSVLQKARDLETAETLLHELTKRIVALDREVAEKKRQADEITQSAREAELLAKDLQSKQKDLDTARDNLHAVEKDIEDLAAWSKAVTDLTFDIAETGKTKERLDEEITDLERRHTEADTTMQKEQEEHAKAQAKLDRAQALLKYRRSADQLAQIEARLAKAKGKADQLLKVECQRAKLPALTERKLRAIQDLEGGIGTLNAQIDIIGITVELTSNKSEKLEIKEPGHSRSLILQHNKTETVKSGQSIELHFQSWGRIRVQSGATELAELLRQRDDTQRKLKSSLTKLGAKSVSEAAALLEKRKDLDGQVREAQHDLQNVLGDYEDLQSFQTEANRERGQIEAFERTLQPTARERQLSLTDVETEAERLGVEIKQAVGRIAKAQGATRQLQEKLTDQRAQQASTRTEMARLQERLNNAQNQITQIESRYSQGLDAAKKFAQREFTEAEARMETVRAKLPADADKLPTRSQRAARAAQEAAANLQDAKAELERLTGRLQTLGAEGIYSRQAELQEKITMRGAVADAARRHGWAARLLHDLLERRKQAATRAVLAPLQERISATFADLTGRHTRRVFLDENLGVRGIGCSESELLLFEQLSQGTREQLLLALRIAVADAVSDSEPQSLILDDVLVNTDPIRQQRVLDLLQSASQHLQILVLTCHPDRYRGIGRQVTIQPREDGHALTP